MISFYKAQADLIRKAIAHIADDDKKLRVGTVDSLPGYGIDVVFLSMVRTMPSRESIEACKRRVISKGESWTDAKKPQFVSAISASTTA